MPAVELHIMLFLIVIEPLIIFYITQKKEVKLFSYKRKISQHQMDQNLRFPIEYIHVHFLIYTSKFCFND